MKIIRGDNAKWALSSVTRASACASLPGSILPHCSEAVNTFAAACQASVKYCLCSVGPISEQLKAAMKTELLPDSQYVEYIAKQICSVSTIVQLEIRGGKKKYREMRILCDETILG